MENPPPRMTLPALWGRVKDGTRLATAGGTWARAVSQSVQHNLRWFFLDGVLSSVQDGTTATFLSLYILALGATSGQIGLMSALGNLSAMLMLLPGAMLAERFGKRKLIVLLFAGGTTRVMVLLIALTPFFLHGAAAIYFIIIFKVIADGSTNLSLPAWTSFAGDIVPLAWRGHYFGSKNLYMAISGVAATFLIGNLLTHNSSIGGYQLAFGIALIFGLGATFSYSHLKELPLSTGVIKQPSYNLKALIQTLKDDRNFLNYAAFGIIWNLAIGIIGPFFNIYILGKSA